MRFPAIAEDCETYPLETDWGWYSFTGSAARRCTRAPAAGDAGANPPRPRVYAGECNFAGQYQQMPAPQGGGMVKAAWFRSCAPNKRPDKFDRIVQSWETAN